MGQDVLEQVGFKSLISAVFTNFDIFRAEADEDTIERGVVGDILLTLLARHFIKRRLRDVEVTGFDQIGHVAAEESEQQRFDVLPVDIRIRHDDDLVVADLFNIEGPFLIAITNAGSDGGDHGLNLTILKRAVKTGLLDVDHFSSQREDGLIDTISA